MLSRAIERCDGSLTVIHAVLVNAARAAQLFAEGLRLISQPILTIAPASNGVSIMDYLCYYRECGELLFDLDRYAAAAAALYNVVALYEQTVFDPTRSREARSAKPRLRLGVIPENHEEAALERQNPVYAVYIDICKRCILYTIVAFGANAERAAQHTVVDMNAVAVGGSILSKVG